MQLKRLKLSGFKSFVEPAELRIEPGLTGVVGPNGCGKSNLLEAIRWVMGENSAKSMRSGGMDDVIFAGTTTRPPRDFAEVVLHGEDDEGDELEVVRRIERGAGSTYRLNGGDVRAKDVALAFADAATGARSPALVSQGKIAQVIAAKPAERRQMLEEAAGIAGLHVRRRDAESKLRSTEKNLERLEDLMAGLDTQIASLRRQAKQADRYKALSDQIAVAEARLLFSRWRDAAKAAEEARAHAQAAEKRVSDAKGASDDAQKAQYEAARRLADMREERADRRDDASAHGHRMASLTTQLEVAEQRLSDLDRQKRRLEEDRGEANRLTGDAADALARLGKELAQNEASLAEDETRQPALAATLEDAERAGRNAELALARATADQAGVEAEWRIADAEVAQLEGRLERVDGEILRLKTQRATIDEGDHPEAEIREAKAEVEQTTAVLAELRTLLKTQQDHKAELQEARDRADSALSEARAELAGIDREFSALSRDRNSRKKQRAQQQGRRCALDEVRVEPGYERALAAVLGRDAKAPLGEPGSSGVGRFWTGSTVPEALPDSLARHVTQCPPQLAARLALVHVAQDDDGHVLEPGEWLVTKAGHLRRWDGFIARGEGAAEAARLEAENRLAELELRVPQLRETVVDAEAKQASATKKLDNVRSRLIALDRDSAQAAESEREALRELDRAEAIRERREARLVELGEAENALGEQREQTLAELAAAKNRRAILPSPDAGRATLEAAQARHDVARSALQMATATLAAHDQALAVARERTAAQRSDMANWQARSGEVAQRLSDMALRLEEIAEERAVFAAKPEGLMHEIEQGDAVRERIAAALEAAEQNVTTAQEAAAAADIRFADTNEALAAAREARAGLAARAENEEARRSEMARISGERFQCPPPLLCERFAFDENIVRNSGLEREGLERLTASRERIGPVNLVATEELAKLEQDQGTSAEEQAELQEAVNRLRGSIGSLNREGRERLSAAFEQVDTHFQRLFTRLFDGGQANLALIDSDDPLEAGLEIYAQPPGKMLQSLTLLSGGEQALTAIALIFGLFLTNPAPICVLDEVDAPLDDANIDRFCDLLDAMSRETDTRYLIVTHNAVTMSRMHRLFGVTMIEKGISRLVSVDLGAAEELATVP